MLSPKLKCATHRWSTLRGRSVAASDWIWRVQNRTDLKLKSDSDAIVRSIWWLLIWRSSGLAGASKSQAIPYIESELRSWRQFKSGASSSWFELQIESEALCTRPVDDSSWYGVSAHPDRDAAVATARILWRPYSDLRDRDNTPSVGRPYLVSHALRKWLLSVRLLRANSANQRRQFCII